LEAPYVLTDQAISGFPHLYDVFHPSSTTNGGMIFLHGGGGIKEKVENSLGASLELAERHSMLLAFPQGQSKQTCRSPPCKAYTWSNYVMDSGQDDVSFLRALVSHLRGSFSLPRMYLTGHSNGGMMANRMWCETGDSLFDGFVSISGPPSSWFAKNSGTEHKACEAASQFGSPPPFLSIFAYTDSVVGHTPEQHIDNELWPLSKITRLLSPFAFVNDALLNDIFAFVQLRAPLRCGESPPRTPSTETDHLRVFSACSGTAAVAAIKGANTDGTCHKISAGHCIAFLQKHLGCGLLDFAGTWLTTGEVRCRTPKDPNTKTNPKSSKKKKVNEKNKFGLLVGVAAAAALLPMVGGAAVLRKRRMDAVEENMDAVEDQFLQYTELPGSAVATEAGPGNGE
jgi:poly(3-hydroxybutyrate) depolymerase